ncbi:Anucleate primary sterigmata protein A [Coniochaeta hoffmannii]|uniref:Anucleate primary sterigmata protein A n=1 Tax=Coniochaeta hoffmannii TaxID=91930 RepID=A0AA38VE36_9PEZI|nr:Anucleate primary sterigmata protein A [Coniochaeta hoffmannii]
MATAGVMPSDKDGSPTHDPFTSPPTGPTRLRYAAFDSNLFALSHATSPDQAKRALEAHLADTQQRMEEAGKLGTTLLQQKKEITERLKEVERLRAEEAELTPELNRKLIELENEYNQVARDSARAFIPKSRVPSNEDPPGAASSPFAPPQGKGGRRSVSPSKFESQGSGSPTKLSVPNRKQRNQPVNRIHDIEFAAEISTSLISQVRQLQALLSEREEELKDIKGENSRLEIEFEAFQQRMKTLDESEHRYKDENWNLETQIHDLIAAQKEAADREKKLQQTLNVLQAEKNSTQRELDEIKLNFSKLDEKHTAAVKQHDIELGTAKRKEILAESERSALQRKVEDLTSQNQELAKAFSQQRGRALEREAALGMSEGEMENGGEAHTPEHSPPPSPIKGTPRHPMLESETLKSSLQHAQRTIQSLRNNVHREKTEKLELRRMLQDARDELEKVRADPNASKRSSRKVDSREFKKPLKPGQLGALRSSRSETFFDEPEWEDHADTGSPRSPALGTPSGRSLVSRSSNAAIPPIAESGSEEHFQTAAESTDAAFETAAETDAAFETAAEDAAFETAHGGTETEDFHTGAEEFSDDDDATETEGSPSRGAGRFKRPPVLPYGHTSRYSFESTASTEDDEDYTMTELKTPTALPPQKLRLRVSRGGAFNLANRRSRMGSEEPGLNSSPASFATNSASGTPQAPGQSLFAELGDLEGSDDESYQGGLTPSRRSTRSMTPGSARGWTASPPPQVPAVPRYVTMDSGTMTDPVNIGPAVSESEEQAKPVPRIAMVDSGIMTEETPEPEMPVLSPVSVVFHERPTSMESVVAPRRLDASTQWLGDEAQPDQVRSRPVSTFSYSDSSAQHDPEMMAKLAEFPLPPTAVPILPPPQELSVSSIHAEHVEPEVEQLPPPPTPPVFGFSSTVAEHVEPEAEQLPPPPTPPVFGFSSTVAEHVEPLHLEEPAPPSLAPSSVVVSLDDEPVVHKPTVALPPPISMAEVRAVELHPRAEPVESVKSDEPVAAPVLPPLVSLSAAPVHAIEVQPIEEPAPPVEELSHAQILAHHVEPASPAVLAPVLELSSIKVLDTEPVSPVKPPLALDLSSIRALVDTEPVSPILAPLEHSSIQALETEPVEPVLEAPTPLGFASVHYLDSEPITPRTPKRNGFIFPSDEDILAKQQQLPPRTPPHAIFGSFIGRNKSKSKVQDSESPIIAEDETRQSLNASPVNDTPESQRPLKELSGNTDARPARKQAVLMSDSGAQTSLTAGAIDELMKVMQSRSTAAPFVAGGDELKDPFAGDDDNAGKNRLSTLFDTVTRSNTVVRKSKTDREPDLEKTPVAAKRDDTPVTAKRIVTPHASVGRRPGSAGSTTSNFEASPLPPLPPNHKEVIEEARLRSSHSAHGSITSGHVGSPTRSVGHARQGSAGGEAAATQLMGPPPLPSAKQSQATETPRLGSSSGGVGTIGTMGPPPLPASYRNRNQRPATPKHSGSGRVTPTLRAGRHGTADVYGAPPPSRGGTEVSRKSSLSSFVSELDNRFDVHNDMAISSNGVFGSRPPTDPRMIRAITQVMIGEYLWKYTRKAGRGDHSENRHRRYFWLHPYNRTLYWSDRDPGSGGRAEHKAKSVPIQAVRMVADNNPMPPGLHNKSLLVISNNRTIKFTATTGQRHETWFNALSFILKKPGEEEEPEDAANSITQEDVAEFNPSFGQRPANGTRAVAPSIHSYNSRSARGGGVESPALDMSMSIPTLTPQTRHHHHHHAASGSQSRFSTLGKISGYWGSLRSRSASRRPSLYEAAAAADGQDDVNDSAEDLRAMIEQQDRESDRLENVRACCDGKHDVGHLPHTHSPKKGRHSHGHPHGPGPRDSTTPTPMASVRSRA